MSERKTTLERKSKETEIKTTLNVDGRGVAKIQTPIGLLNHMLELFAFHGFFDLELEVKGDTHIDIHHTNEDIGIVLGKIFKKALGENFPGIKRFGRGAAPMESTWADVIIDLSGRGYFSSLTVVGSRIFTMNAQEGYSFSDLEHFLESFALNMGATLNGQITNPSGSADLHTVMETVFKSLGLALDQATQIDSRRTGTVPSTKGIID